MRWIVILVFLFSCLVTGCGSSNNKAAAPRKDNETIYKWDFFVVLPTTQMRSKPLDDFAKSVKEKSGGRLVITPKAAGEVPYKGPEAIRITRDGSVQMADATMAFIAGDLKAAAVPSWPFLCAAPDEFNKAVEAVRPIVNEEMKVNGVEVLFWFPDPPQRFWGKGRPIHSFADLKGKKIRTPSPEASQFIKDIGAIPVSMTSPEVPSAMQKGIIDAMITSAITVNDGKFYEFLDWGYTIPFSGSGGWVIVNSKLFAELPKDLQDIMRTEAKKYQEIAIQSVSANDKIALENIKAQGVTLIDPDASAIKQGYNMSKENWTKYAKEGGPWAEKALQAILEALQK
jgi:TRAP-type C4-dicarboxylate transport system substrate-binding protein